MKLHLTIFAFILLGLNSAYSQNNNLQFNQALFGAVSQTFPNTPNDGIPLVIGSITIPVGKVWKIESASGLTLLPNNNYSFGVTKYIINNFSMDATEKPIWLPAGSYTIKRQNEGAVPVVVTYTFNYSGIEFNVVP